MEAGPPARSAAAAGGDRHHRVLAYTLLDGLDDLDGPVTALLFLSALAIQGTLFFLGAAGLCRFLALPSTPRR